ncbi:hypothetical protein [Agrobacterium pusense]|uniref:hypothetical protein n=1 Tax=Agrobacterium pusense TaxID=648995 RepID=UPI002FDDB52F
MTSRMFAYGFSGSPLDYELPKQRKTHSLEERWSRVQGLIPARVLEDTVQVDLRAANLEVEQDFSALISVLEDDGEITPHTFSEQSDVPSFQLHLWSDTSFSPSNTLIQLWREGLAFHLEASGTDTSAVADLTSSAMRREFGIKLKGALIAELRFLRQSAPLEYVIINDKNTLTPRMELCLSALVPIRPSDLGRFISALTEELVNHFAAGFVLKGEWGQVRQLRGSVVAELNPAVPISYDRANKTTLDIEL